MQALSWDWHQNSLHAQYKSGRRGACIESGVPGKWSENTQKINKKPCVNLKKTMPVKQITLISGRKLQSLLIPIGILVMTQLISVPGASSELNMYTIYTPISNLTCDYLKREILKPIRWPTSAPKIAFTWISSLIMTRIHSLFTRISPRIYLYRWQSTIWTSMRWTAR